MRVWTILAWLTVAACTAPAADDSALGRGSGESPRAPGATGSDDETSGPAADGGSDGSASTSPTAPPPPGVGSLKPGKTTLSLKAAGKSRSLIVIVPSAITSQAVPLVVALHGNGDTAANFVATRGFEELAESKGFVVVAPQGIVQNISVGGQQVNGVSWDAYRDLASGNIDLALLEEIQKELVTPGGQIDPKRVVVFGYSQGGYLSFRYGIDASAKLACAAVIAAASPLGAKYVSQATRKIPFALTIGDKDYAIAQAREAKAALEANGHPLLYKEIAGAGHSPFPGPTTVPLDYCLMHSLP